MEKKFEISPLQLALLGVFTPTDKPSSLYYIWGNFKINEKVDFEKLNKSINYCIEKNESLRLKYCYEDGVLKQYFSEYEPVKIETVDLENESQIDELINKINSTPIDVIDNYLFNIKMYRLPNGNGGVIIKVDHTIADGWSLGLVGYEVVNHYLGKFVLPITGSYSEYLEKKNRYESSFRMEIDEKYWKNIFKDGIPNSVTYPYSKPVNNQCSLICDKIKFDIDENVINNIKEYCKKHKLTTSKFYISIYALLLSKINNNRKFVFNSISANRKNIKERFTTGFLVSFTYFLVECQKNVKFYEFVNAMNNSVNQGYKHRDYWDKHLAELVATLDPNMNTNLSPINFSYQNINMKTSKKDLDYEVTGDNSPTSGGLDMAIHVFDLESENKVQFIYDYLIDKYDESAMKTFNNQILDIIHQVLENDDIYIDDITVKDSTLVENK